MPAPSGLFAAHEQVLRNRILKVPAEADGGMGETQQEESGFLVEKLSLGRLVPWDSQEGVFSERAG